MATGQMGLVGIRDAIAFDEVADLQKMPKEVVTTLKTDCESGTFARGKDAFSGMATPALFGTTNQPVAVMVRPSHRFTQLPDVIREDLAFLDRIHFYVPGWEVPKMRVEFFTDRYGFVVDYLAEALRELCKHNFTEVIEHHFALGAHLNAHDGKAVRKSVSGLLKLVSVYSALKRHSVVAGLVILGDLSIPANIKSVRSLAEPLPVAMDNGARRALIPLEHKRNFLEVSGDIVERDDGGDEGAGDDLTVGPAIRAGPGWWPCSAAAGFLVTRARVRQNIPHPGKRAFP
jgi:uncharacterized protein (TIGR02688 family)